MLARTRRSTLPDTLCPYTTLCRARCRPARPTAPPERPPGRRLVTTRSSVPPCPGRHDVSERVGHRSDRNLDEGGLASLECRHESVAERVRGRRPEIGRAHV